MDHGLLCWWYSVLYLYCILTCLDCITSNTVTQIYHSWKKKGQKWCILVWVKKKHLCTFQRQRWLRLLEESLTVGERAKSEKPLVSADVGQLNINKEKISSKKRWRKLNIREEQKGREREREREVCFVTVGGTSQREKATEIKSGAAINAISEFKIEKYR